MGPAFLGQGRRRWGDGAAVGSIRSGAWRRMGRCMRPAYRGLKKSARRHCACRHGGGSSPDKGRGVNPGGGGLGPRAFWGLTDSTHLASLAPNSQGVASPTNGGNLGGRSDATTDRMMGEVGRIPPPTEMKTGRVSTGSGGVRTGPPPTHN